VYLRVALLIGVGAPRNEVHEVVVVVYPRPLPEVFGRLHGQRVETEVHAQQLAHRPVTLVVQVEPEELGPAERGEHILRRGRLVGATLAQRASHSPSLTAAYATLVDTLRCRRVEVRSAEAVRVERSG
jgi:hypothetical protein